MTRLPLVAAVAALLAGSLPARAYEVFVTNERDNTVSVIDSKTFAVTRTFKVGQRPRGVVFSKDGKILYVCASDSDAVEEIDPDTGKLLHDLPSGEDPEQFAISPDGKRLYIANENNAATTIIDLATRKVLSQIDVGIEPEGMAVSPDSNTAVTTSETTNMVHWIDPKTFQSNDATPVGQRPREAKFSKDGALLWVSSEVGGTVAIIDVASKKVVHTISFALPSMSADKIQPVGISLTSDGKLAFIALGPRRPCRGRRCQDLRGEGLHPRRPARLAHGVLAGARPAVHDQRRLRRRHGDQRRQSEADPHHQGRALPVGRRRAPPAAR